MISSGSVSIRSQRHSANSGLWPPAGRVDVDLALVAGEAQRVPLLRLPAILAAPGLADDLARDVVAQPLLDLAELLDRADVGLLVQFAQRRQPRVLALVDAALRHLPGMRGHRRARGRRCRRPTNTRPCAVEHHRADAGTVGKQIVACHGDPRFGTAKARRRSIMRAPGERNRPPGATSSRKARRTTAYRAWRGCSWRGGRWRRTAGVAPSRPGAAERAGSVPATRRSPCRASSSAETGIWTSWRMPLVPSMMVMVLLGGATTGVASILVASERCTVAGDSRMTRISASSAWPGGFAGGLDVSGCHRLPAERLVGQEHPAGANTKAQGQDPGDQVQLRQRQLARRSRRLGSGPTGRSDHPLSRPEPHRIMGEKSYVKICTWSR